MKKKIILGLAVASSAVAGYGHPLDWTYLFLLVVCGLAGVGGYVVSEAV